MSTVPFKFREHLTVPPHLELELWQVMANFARIPTPDICVSASQNFGMMAVAKAVAGNARPEEIAEVVEFEAIMNKIGVWKFGNKWSEITPFKVAEYMKKGA